MYDAGGAGMGQKVQVLCQPGFNLLAGVDAVDDRIQGQPLPLLSLFSFLFSLSRVLFLFFCPFRSFSISLLHIFLPRTFPVHERMCTQTLNFSISQMRKQFVMAAHSLTLHSAPAMAPDSLTLHSAPAMAPDSLTLHSAPAMAAHSLTLHSAPAMAAHSLTLHSAPAMAAHSLTLHSAPAMAAYTVYKQASKEHKFDDMTFASVMATLGWSFVIHAIFLIMNYIMAR
jgi:hypothetical protein